MSKRIVKTEAVVLKRMDYLESSRIVTLFTRSEGKVSVLAKGARSTDNRFGSSLEPGSYSTVVYYTRPHRELQTLTQSDCIERLRGVTRSMAHLSGALHLLDLTHAVTQPGHPHPELFDLLIRALKVLDRRDKGLPELLLAYRLQVSRLSGFSPALWTCAKCGGIIDDTSSSEFVMDIRRGGILCPRCSEGSPIRFRYTSGMADGGVLLASSQLRQLRWLLGAEVEELSASLLGREEWNELDDIVRLYERHHMLHGKTLKTEQMVREFITE